MVFVSLLSLMLCISSLQAKSLTLRECIERALERNADVISANYGVDRSAADVQAARAGLMPTLDATLFGFVRSTTGPSVRIQENPTNEVDPLTGRRIFREEETLIPAFARNSFSMSASLNQTIYDGGRRINAWRKSKTSYQSAEKQLEARKAEVTLEVSRRYYELLKARELVAVQEESVRLSQRQLADTKARREAGTATKRDELRLSVELDNTQAQLINAQHGIVLAKAGLNHILGEEIDASLDIASIPGNEKMKSWEGNESDFVARAIEKSPFLIRFNKDLVAAEYDLAQVRGARHPRLVGNVSYSRNNEILDRVFGNLNKNYRFNVGMTLSYNLFDGGLKGANIVKSRAAVEIARTNLRLWEREIALEVKTAYLDLIRLQKILKIAERTVKLAKEDLRLAEERYRVGKGRLLEVLDAQVGFTEAQSNRVRTRYDLRIVEAELEKAIGGESW